MVNEASHVQWYVKCSLLDGASSRRIVGKFDPAISAFLLPNISTFYIIIIIIIIIIYIYI